MKITRRQLRQLLIESNEVNKSIINQTTTLQELLELGLINDDDIQKWNNKLSGAADRAEREAQLKNVITAIIDLVTSDENGSNHFWSPREIMTYIKADRNMILKALKVLTNQGYLTLVGLKNVDGKLVVVDKSQANAFQLRYMVTSNL